MHANQRLEYQMAPIITMSFGLCSALGPMLGVLLATPFITRFGYRKTAIIFLITGISATFMPFFSQRIEHMITGFLLQCVPWGVYQVIAPAFISEVASLALRPISTTWNNLCWIIGQVIASLVAMAFNGSDTNNAYRIPIALNWVFAVILLLGMWFVPESPVWFLKRGQRDPAKKAASKLWKDEARAKGKIESMLSTIYQEETSIHMQAAGTIPDVGQGAALELSGRTQTTPNITAVANVDPESGPASLTQQEARMRLRFKVRWLQALRGKNRRRTILTCVIWLLQASSGHALTSWATKLFESAGLSSEQAIQINMATPALGVVGTVSACFIMLRAGRKTMYMLGLSVMCILLAVVGGTAFIPDHQIGGYITGSIIALYNLAYQIAVGPIAYVLVSELPSFRLRAETLAIARTCYLIGNALSQIIVAYVMQAAGLGPKVAFVYAAICAAGAIFTRVCVPETKGLTATEIDGLF
jgi:MFS transporter, SP family, general alpha glucoside:H+ symporter